MHLHLLTEAGQIVEGVILAVGDHRLRVVLRGKGDTMELRYRDGQWATARDQVYELATLATLGCDTHTKLLNGVIGRQVMGAGGSPVLHD